MHNELLQRIINGRTDLVFDYLAGGHAASTNDGNGTPLIRWCAYYGDVSALRFLLEQGETLASLGENFDLQGAAFHGHWRLCQFLLEQGADPNYPLPDSGETPLHAVLCKPDSLAHTRVVQVLITAGANPCSVTKPGIETGCFMRDVRTRAETPLHRAAAFGTEQAIQLLLDAGAPREVHDMNGDSPLTWASWHQRPASILRLLCYGRFSVRPNYRGMEANLLGDPDLGQ